MVGVRVTAHNSIGEKALRIHLAETQKGSHRGVNRLYRTITQRKDPVREILVSDVPMVLELTIVDPVIANAINPKMLVQKADEVMRLNGAKPGDYKIEVLK
jgi:hypothetical protein